MCAMGALEACSLLENVWRARYVLDTQRECVRPALVRRLIGDAQNACN